MIYTEAKKLFLLGNFSCSNWFKDNGYILEYSYCLLLKGNINQAKKEFKKISQFDFRANWAESLLPLLDNSKIEGYPTFLQVRDFLEIDLDFLLTSNQLEYCQNLLKNAKFLFSINRESYKLIGRVLLNNGFEELAEEFFRLALNNFFQDPELHYILAKHYLGKNKIDLSKKHINYCLEMIPEYYPATKLANEINNRWQ